MRETVSISLPEDVKDALDEAVAEEGVSRSDLVRQALRDFLFVRQFRQLRQRLIPHAEAQGIYSDEDVSKCVS
ncbi:MAG: ribbon-helix-helix domain-containing protein [Rhodothermales bacterium]